VKVLALGGSGKVGHDVLAAGMDADDLDVWGLDRAGVDLRDMDSIGVRLSDFRFDMLINHARFVHLTSDYPMLARRSAFSVLNTRNTTALTGRMSPWDDALRRYLVTRARKRGPSTAPTT
jgi:dTDP-4-dehydrorhamnose reductase